jgi:hypothetical protein
VIKATRGGQVAIGEEQLERIEAPGQDISESRSTPVEYFELRPRRIGLLRHRREGSAKVVVRQAFQDFPVSSGQAQSALIIEDLQQTAQQTRVLFGDAQRCLELVCVEPVERLECPTELCECMSNIIGRQRFESCNRGAVCDERRLEDLSINQGPELRGDSRGRRHAPRARRRQPSRLVELDGRRGPGHPGERSRIDPFGFLSHHVGDDHPHLVDQTQVADELRVLC